MVVRCLNNVTLDQGFVIGLTEILFVCFVEQNIQKVLLFQSERNN